MMLNELLAPQDCRSKASGWNGNMATHRMQDKDSFYSSGHVYSALYRNYEYLYNTSNQPFHQTNITSSPGLTSHLPSCNSPLTVPAGSYPNTFFNHSSHPTYSDESRSNSPESSTYSFTEDRTSFLESGRPVVFQTSVPSEPDQFDPFLNEHVDNSIVIPPINLKESDVFTSAEIKSLTPWRDQLIRRLILASRSTAGQQIQNSGQQPGIIGHQLKANSPLPGISGQQVENNGHMPRHCGQQLGTSGQQPGSTGQQLGTNGQQFRTTGHPGQQSVSPREKREDGNKPRMRRYRRRPAGIVFRY